MKGLLTISGKKGAMAAEFAKAEEFELGPFNSKT